MQQYGSMVANILVISELKPETAHDPPLRSSLIRAHSVYLHDKIMLEKMLKCTADIIRRQHCFVKYFCMK